LVRFSRYADNRLLAAKGPKGSAAGYYTNELHHRGYQKATCYLPHDGMNANAVTGLQYADHLRDAQFTVEVIPKPGGGRCCHADWIAYREPSASARQPED
jgi:hypothetical protein